MAEPTVKDVAEHAGVSAGTVSNVLNRPQVVSAATRRRVLAAIDELGFVRNASARALRTGRSLTVGMLVLDVGNPFFTDVARGADAIVEQRGSVLTLWDLAEDPDRQRRTLDQLGELRVQGVLLTPVAADDPAIEGLVQRGVPVVLVDRASSEGQRCSATVDDVLGGRLAAAHLLEEGHRHVAFVGGPMHLRQVSERLQGARLEVEAAGATLTTIEPASLTIRGGLDAGRDIAGLAARRRPTAVFCANDLLALGILQAFTRAGLRVPQDIAIVGYDDIDFAAGAAVPLSSVRQPRQELGRAAAELLFDELDHGLAHRHRQVVFQPELIVRDSTRRPA